MSSILILGSICSVSDLSPVIADSFRRTRFSSYVGPFHRPRKRRSVNTSPESIWNQIGGPRLISRQIWILSSVIAILSVMVEADGNNSSRSNVTLVPAAILSCFIAGGVSYILHRTICKGRDIKPVSPIRSIFALTLIAVFFFGPLTVINYLGNHQSTYYTFPALPLLAT